MSDIKYLDLIGLSYFWQKTKPINSLDNVEQVNSDGTITKGSDYTKTVQVGIIKDYIDSLVSSIPKFAIKVVETLPTTDISNTTVYLVKTGTTSQQLYTEYIYVNNAWEKLGDIEVDLTDYAKKQYVTDAIQVETTRAQSVEASLSSSITSINTTIESVPTVAISDSEIANLK